VFYKGVRHPLRFCFGHFNCVKMAAFSFIFARGNREKYGKWKPPVMLFLSKISWRKKSETVHCRDATASSFVAKVRDEVFAHFQVIAVKASQQYEEISVRPSRKNFV
jgi:hypothetical protein